MNIQSISTSLPLQGTSEASASSAAFRAAKSTVLPPQDQQTVKPAAANLEQLKAAVQSVREYVKPFNNSLEFSVIDDTHQLVVKVVDNATKEVVRQIPSEEMVAIAKALDSLKGLFVKQQA